MARAAYGASRTRVFAALVSALERVDRHEGAFAVLMYHRVAEPTAGGVLDPALISTTPAEFEEQIGFLAKTRPLISLADLEEAIRGRRSLPPGSVMITFDDAYRDFAEHAWPTLRRHGAPVTLFVATAYPDRPDRQFWWDRLHQVVQTTSRTDVVETPAGRLPLGSGRDRAAAVRVLRQYLTSMAHAEAMAALRELTTQLGSPPAPSAHAVLGWDDLRSLARDGVVLAPHSRTHPRLDRVPPDEAREEVLGSLADLEGEIGSAPRVFAYPGGGYTPTVKRILADEGFAAAFTTARGLNDARRADWLELRRINIGRRATLPLVRAQLVAWPSRRLGRKPVPA